MYSSRAPKAQGGRREGGRIYYRKPHTRSDKRGTKNTYLLLSKKLVRPYLARTFDARHRARSGRSVLATTHDDRTGPRTRRVPSPTGTGFTTVYSLSFPHLLLQLQRICRKLRAHGAA